MKNQVLEKVIQCEEAYKRCFCEVIDTANATYYMDSLLSDMYDYNFTLLKKEQSISLLQAFVSSETRKCIERGKKFYKLTLPNLPKEDIKSCKGKEAEVEILGTYLCDLNKVARWRENTELTIKQITSSKQIEELIELDLIHDKETCGEDFCKRRARRRGKVYLSNDKPCNSYIGYYEGKAVANCDLCIDGEVAKIEDFAVIPIYQRKGIGTTLLRNLIEIAQKQGAKIIYLNADEEDTPKEMYTKLGFTKIGEQYSLFWNLADK